ncbi:CLPTM1 (predicted), partial [Pycnogonum litorale]
FRTLNMADSSSVSADRSVDSSVPEQTNDAGNVLIPPENSNTTVATATAAADGNPNGTVQQETQQPASTAAGWGSTIKSIFFRIMFIYFVTQFFRRPQTNNNSNNNSSVPSLPSSNIFPNGTIFDVYAYVSEDEMFHKFDDQTKLWFQPGITYGDWVGKSGDGSYSLSTSFATSRKIQNNGSIYLHLYIVKSGFSPDPASGKDGYSRRHTIHHCKRLNKYKKKRIVKTHSLLGSEEKIVEKIEDKPKMISHWHPNLTINIVDDHSPWIQGQVPSPLNEYVHFDVVTGKYYPVVFFNDYWNYLRDYQPINDTVEFLTIHLTFRPISLFKWQMYAAQQMRSKWTNVLGTDMMEESEEEQDTLKETFLETNPYLLGMTVAISILHSIFEFLAFKNDIQFWNNRKSLEGLSVRSVFFNVFQSLIVLLYVLDNEANTVIKISCGVGLLIEIWKIKKVVNIEIVPGEKIAGIIPRIGISDKGSYADSSTKQYDQMAFKYLSWALFPLLAGYSVYSVVYLEHKGWYSWVLSMFYGFLLTFGFIMMTPQLFINYKMKSVAHLPWRMMTYKALNTFIDDIFAFVIKMPTMYRIGCFRDDLIFFIYLY